MNPTRRLREAFAGSLSAESGFTLSEMLVVIAISSTLVLAIASAFVVGLKTTVQAETRLRESHDAQLLATYFGSDVGSADSIFTSGVPAGACGVGLAGTTVVRFEWTDTGVAKTAFYVTPAGSPETLVRRYCENGAVISDIKVVQNLDRATLSCSPTNCIEPSRVELTIVETSGWDYILQALPRSTQAAQILEAPPLAEWIRRKTPAAEMTNDTTVTWEVHFSERVRYVRASDFILVDNFEGGEDASITSLSPSLASSLRDTWTVTATITGSPDDDTLRLDLRDSDLSIKDTIGTPISNPTFSDPAASTYTLDQVRPTVALARAPGQGVSTNTLPVRFTATFSEPVLAFDLSDVTLTGATSDKMTISGTGPVYDIEIDNISAATVSVSIPAGRVTDAAGNTNTASAVPSVIYDPNLAVVRSINRHSSDPNPASLTANSMRWVVTFSEAVRSVDSGDFDLVETMNGSASITSVTASGASPSTTWTVTANTSGLSGTGTLGLDLDDDDTIRTGSSGGTRLGGTGLDNGNFAGQVYVLDREPPGATLARADGQLPTATTLPLRFTVTFNEPVVGFDTTDITRTGAAAGATVNMTATGDRSYNVTLQGVSVGTSTISIAAGRVKDELGNDNVASATVSVYYDPALLRVVSINRLDTEATEAGSVRWLVTFSEAVRNVSSDDFNLIESISGSVSYSSVTPTGGSPSTTWTVTANTSSLTGAGTLRLDLDDDDTIRSGSSGGKRLGDPNVDDDGDFTGQSYTIDRTPPAITGVELKNKTGGVAGKIEQSDQVIVTFSRRMRVSSFCDDWSDNASDQMLDVNDDVTVTVDNEGGSGDNDSILVSSASCTFKFGEIDLDDDDFVSGDRTFRGSGVDKSTIQWDATNFRLIVTLGKLTSGSTNIENNSQQAEYESDDDLRGSTGHSVSNASFNLPSGVLF